MAMALILALLVASILTGRPASAATLQPLPATVRVNVAGLGIFTSARFGSTKTLVVTNNEVNEIYRGSGTVVVRAHVLRSKDGRWLLDRREPATDPATRAARLATLRDARVGEREGGESGIRVVGFEISVASATDPIGTTLLAAPRPVLVTFTSPDGMVTFQQRPFVGRLELALDDVEDLIAVNTVPTFDYLASAVGSEVPDSWHPEALATQAIAARTYLATRLKAHNAYDIEGDTRDQAYEGFDKVSNATIRAVERTRGIVATYEGAPIEALYSASAGGLTEDSEQVFGKEFPYLRSVPSPFDTAALNSSWGRTSWTWTKELTASALGWQLERKSLDVGEPLRIDLLEFSPTGRVTQARVVGTRATRYINRDRSRYYFELMSTLFTVTKSGDVFTFTGKGFGHGVGMSQWGMQGMALAGKTAREILAYYYRGIALTDTGGD
ncbi:MAG: SpoIID/LytB domain-containing protein [Chloroflexi bacterium]|nr:SpoIID/LytB domain-containing protein [Chloroflexota bacterium]